MTAAAKEDIKLLSSIGQLYHRPPPSQGQGQVGGGKGGGGATTAMETSSTLSATQNSANTLLLAASKRPSTDAEASLLGGDNNDNPSGNLMTVLITGAAIAGVAAVAGVTAARSLQFRLVHQRKHLQCFDFNSSTRNNQIRDRIHRDTQTAKKDVHDHHDESPSSDSSASLPLLHCINMPDAHVNELAALFGTALQSSSSAAHATGTINDSTAINSDSPSNVMLRPTRTLVTLYQSAGGGGILSSASSSGGHTASGKDGNAGGSLVDQEGGIGGGDDDAGVGGGGGGRLAKIGRGAPLARNGRAAAGGNGGGKYLADCRQRVLEAYQRLAQKEKKKRQRDEQLPAEQDQCPKKQKCPKKISSAEKQKCPQTPLQIPCVAENFLVFVNGSEPDIFYTIAEVAKRFKGQRITLMHCLAFTVDGEHTEGFTSSVTGTVSDEWLNAELTAASAALQQQEQQAMKEEEEGGKPNVDFVDQKKTKKEDSDDNDDDTVDHFLRSIPYEVLFNPNPDSFAPSMRHGLSTNALRALLLRTGANAGSSDLLDASVPALVHTNDSLDFIFYNATAPNKIKINDGQNGSDSSVREGQKCVSEESDKKSYSVGLLSRAVSLLFPKMHVTERRSFVEVLYRRYVAYHARRAGKLSGSSLENTNSSCSPTSSAEEREDQKKKETPLFSPRLANYVRLLYFIRYGRQSDPEHYPLLTALAKLSGGWLVPKMVNASVVSTGAAPPPHERRDERQMGSSYDVHSEPYSHSHGCTPYAIIDKEELVEDDVDPSDLFSLSTSAYTASPPPSFVSVNTNNSAPTSIKGGGSWGSASTVAGHTQNQSATPAALTTVSNESLGHFNNTNPYYYHAMASPSTPLARIMLTPRDLRRLRQWIDREWRHCSAAWAALRTNTSPLPLTITVPSEPLLMTVADALNAADGSGASVASAPVTLNIRDICGLSESVVASAPHLAARYNAIVASFSTRHDAHLHATFVNEITVSFTVSEKNDEEKRSIVSSNARVGGYENVILGDNNSTYFSKFMAENFPTLYAQSLIIVANPNNGNNSNSGHQNNNVVSRPPTLCSYRILYNTIGHVADAMTAILEQCRVLQLAGSENVSKLVVHSCSLGVALHQFQEGGDTVESIGLDFTSAEINTKSNSYYSTRQHRSANLLAPFLISPTGRQFVNPLTMKPLTLVGVAAAVVTAEIKSLNQAVNQSGGRSTKARRSWGKAGGIRADPNNPNGNGNGGGDHSASPLLTRLFRPIPAMLFGNGGSSTRPFSARRVRREALTKANALLSSHTGTVGLFSTFGASSSHTASFVGLAGAPYSGAAMAALLAAFECDGAAASALASDNDRGNSANNNQEGGSFTPIGAVDNNNAVNDNFNIMSITNSASNILASPMVAAVLATTATAASGNDLELAQMAATYVSRHHPALAVRKGLVPMGDDDARDRNLCSAGNCFVLEELRFYKNSNNNENKSQSDISNANSDESRDLGYPLLESHERYVVPNTLGYASAKAMGIKKLREAEEAKRKEKEKKHITSKTKEGTVELASYRIFSTKFTE